METFSADGRACRDQICLSCPNDCRLTIAVRGDRSVELQGNGCAIGLEFARSILDDGKKRTGR